VVFHEEALYQVYTHLYHEFILCYTYTLTRYTNHAFFCLPRSHGLLLMLKYKNQDMFKVKQIAYRAFAVTIVSASSVVLCCPAADYITHAFTWGFGCLDPLENM